MLPAFHFPCNETSGTTITCDVTGTILDSDYISHGVANAVSYPVPSTQKVTYNNLGLYRQGRLIVYFASTIDSTITASNNKCSLSHLNSLGRTRLDVQREWTLTDTVFRTIHAWGTNSGALDQIRAGLTLSGADSIETYNSGMHTGCVVISFNTKTTPAFHRADGTKFTFEPSFTGRSNWGTYGKYDWCLPYIDCSPAATGLTPVDDDIVPNPIDPIFKGSDLYVFGAWYFRHHNPTDAEIATFTAWLDTEARSGNKEHYPAWLALADEPE